MKFWALGVLFLLTHWAAAQTKVLFPYERQVFQRNQSNEATISILGNCSVEANRVQAKLEVVKAGQGVSTAWQDISPRPAGGLFNGKIQAKGGWYTLKIRVYKGQTLLDSAQVTRVGIGENYLIAGQSNSQGTIRQANEKGATDDRVIAANFYAKDLESNKGGNYRYLGEQNLDFPMDQFVQMDSLSTIGPIGLSPYYWAALGDSLVKTYQVPVCFINTGWTATSIRNWVESAEGLASTNPFASILSYPKGFPYENLKRSLQVFGKNMGFRAILWHQGETDGNFDMPKLDYQNYLKKLIQYSRRDAGYNIPWLVSEASYFAALKSTGCTPGKINADIIQAQRDILKLDDLPSVFAGPSTDDVEIPRKSDDISLCVHFTKEAYGELAQRWLSKIKILVDTKDAKPLLADNLPVISATCLTDTSKIGVAQLIALPGRNVDWVDANGTVIASASKSQSLSAGKYQLAISDSLGQKQLTPYFNLSQIAKPSPPTITTSGSLQFCQGQQVTLEAKSGEKNFIWASGESTSAITVSNSGIYRVRVKDELNCISNFSSSVTTRMYSNPNSPTVSQISPYFLNGGVKLTDIEFNWSVNNGPVLPDKGVNLRVNQSGVYKVFASKQYIDGPKCISNAVELTYALPNDGGVTVYPNPATTSVVIQSKANLAGAKFELYSIDGRMILDGTINQDGAFGLKTDGYAAGFYKLVIRSQSNEILQKTIVIGQ